VQMARCFSDSQGVPMTEKNQNPQERPEAAIDALCAKIGALLKKEEHTRVASRYDIAKALLDAKGPNGRATYGAAVVETVARRQHLSAKTLHRWIQVAEAFDPKEMRALHRRRRKRSGAPFEWKHYEVLASAPETIREKMIEATVAKDLSARRFERHIEDCLQKQRDAHPKTGAGAAAGGSEEEPEDSQEATVVTPALCTCLQEIEDYVSGAVKRAECWIANLTKAGQKPASTDEVAARAAMLVGKAEALIEKLLKIAAIAEEGCAGTPAETA
jgi:hypothetical protein